MGEEGLANAAAVHGGDHVLGTVPRHVDSAVRPHVGVRVDHRTGCAPARFDELRDDGRSGPGLHSRTSSRITCRLPDAIAARSASSIPGMPYEQRRSSHGDMVVGAPEEQPPGAVGLHHVFQPAVELVAGGVQVEVEVAFEKRPKEAVIAPAAVVGGDQHQVGMGLEHVVQELPPLLDVHEERYAPVRQLAKHRSHRDLVEQIAMGVRTCPYRRDAMVPHPGEQLVHRHLRVRGQDVPDRQEALACPAERRYLGVRFERVGEVPAVVVDERTVDAAVVHLIQQCLRDERGFEGRKQACSRVGVAVEELDALARHHAASPVAREAAAWLIRPMICATSASVLSGWVSTHTVLPRMSIDGRHISFE